jgi:hypothetical protein
LIFKISIREFNKFKENAVTYENNKRKLPCSSASDLTLFIQKSNLSCYLRHCSNGFRRDNSIKKNAPFWRGVYQCTNNGCCKFEINVDFDEESDEMVEFSCLIYGETNHTEKINNEALKRITSKEKLQVALKLLANSNNIETVANLAIDDLNKKISSNIPQSESNSNKLLGQISFDNIKTMNLKNKLKDRYRKILEDFDGKSNIVIIRLKFI